MKPIFNRNPLIPNTLSPLPLGAIRPEDWLKEQLELQAAGITRRFAQVCGEIAADGAWRVSEDGDCARGAYYLEGLIALAWTLDDADMKARALKSVEWILQSQREDGWFGPAENDDYWPLILAVRALRLYFTASGDKRVLVLMDRFFKFEYRTLEQQPLKEWAVARGGDNMETVLWLYNITGQNYLLELAKKLREQTLDWTSIFHTFPNATPMNRAQRWERLHEALGEEKNEPLEGAKRPYFHSQFHQTEGTNVAFGLKTPGVINLFKSGFKEQGGFRFGWEKLMKYHGIVNGMFSCDNHLNGGSPSQGSTLQALTELMNTMETLIALGDFGPETADVLEKLAYNVLPASFSADGTAYQRIQQANQVRISRGAHKWYNAPENGNLFTGARDEINCAACHEAWPKFVSSLWYATADGGLSAVSYAPCTVRATLDGTPVRIRVSGGYPFMQSVEIAVSAKVPADFPLYLRIPFWARQPMIYTPDGEIMQVRAGETACVRRKWRTGDVLRLEMPVVPHITRWYHQSGAVEVGPLVMTMRPEAKWTHTGDESGAEAGEDWNWALVREEPMKLIQVEEDISAFGRGESAVSVMVKAARVPWPMDGESCAAVPMVPQLNRTAVDILELVPYGEAPLRISEFPMGVVRTGAE